MGIEDYLPIHTQEEINPIQPGDYTVDGIVYCGVCHRPKQYRAELFGTERIVPCICDCERRKEEQREQEYEAEEQMRRIERLRSGSMIAGRLKEARLSSYTKRPENEAAYNVAVSYCERWQDMKKCSQGLIFYGPVGTGKSYTAACIGNELIDKGVPVIMTSFVKILQDIQSQDEGEYLSVLNSASLLIIDDLGAERGTDYALEKVYNVTDSRVRTGKPMILTTNLDLSQMIDCTDIRYKRVYDRILEVCFPVEIAGSSFREENASERFEEMKKFIGG